MEENITIYLVTGSTPMPYWTDRICARYFNWKILHGKGTILSDNEFVFLNPKQKSIVVAFGSVDVNLVARDITRIYPQPIIKKTGLLGNEYYLYGGIQKNENGYKIIDPCIMLAGRTIRGTYNAVRSAVNGSWYEIIKQFIDHDWNAIKIKNDTPWAIKYWQADQYIDEKQSSPKINGDTYIQKYVEAVKNLRMANPTLEQLQAATEVSVKIWSRNLKDPVFLFSLKKEIKKRQSGKYSKTVQSRAMWSEVEKQLDIRIETTKLSNDALSRPKNVEYNDNKRTHNPYSDLNSEYNDEQARQ